MPFTHLINYICCRYDDFVVGAPGTDVDGVLDSGNNKMGKVNLLVNIFYYACYVGAIYLVFIARGSFFDAFNFTTFYCLVSILPSICCCCICGIICAFMYFFRHREDETEKIAREAGVDFKSVKFGQNSTRSKIGRNSTKVVAESPVVPETVVAKKKVELTDISDKFDMLNHEDETVSNLESGEGTENNDFSTNYSYVSPSGYLTLICT